jgi:hypothetical protein
MAARVNERQVDPQVLAQLCAGMEVLRLHRQRDFALLAAWRGREEELLSMLAKDAAGPGSGLDQELHKVAQLARRVGYLLEKERRIPPLALPTPLRSQARELSLANARFTAAGGPLPFSPNLLSAVPPGAVTRALETLRHSGFLSDGPQWALRAAAAAPVADLVRKALERVAEQELDR